jgi:hypothetical protein
MLKYASLALLLLQTLLSACTTTVLVPVSPRMDLKGYGTLGIVEFTSNSDAAINARATRQFQENIQSAQPGTRFLDLGSRESLLAAVGAKQLDVDALKQIGQKYSVDAIFLGEPLCRA